MSLNKSFRKQFFLKNNASFNTKLIKVNNSITSNGNFKKLCETYLC